MIVRLMGQGQYRVDDALRERLNEIDAKASAAVEANDEEGLREHLEELARVVETEGERLEDGDLSLEEARELFTGEGLIPDLPV